MTKEEHKEQTIRLRKLVAIESPNATLWLNDDGKIDITGFLPDIEKAEKVLGDIGFKRISLTEDGVRLPFITMGRGL